MAKELNPNFDDLNSHKVINSHVQKLVSSKAEDLKQRYADLEVKATDVIPPPEIAWEQVVNENRAILGTLGNFSLIIGKAKSRKSFFINIAISTVLKEDLLFNQFRGVLPKDKRKVIYFDTEQGKYHVQLALKRICEQINIDIPKDLKVYYLRTKKPAERLKIIEDIIYNTENLGFVVIDGIKDLVTSINDEGEATMIASNLLKWTEEKNIHITTVLHQNKGDSNARGHIGTELINKAETVLSVSKNEQDKDISVVEAQQCRNKDPEPFGFEINKDGLPVIVEDFKIRTETKKNKFDVMELDDINTYNILEKAYKNGKEFSYSNLKIQIKIAYKNKFNKNLGDNRAKEIITICKNKGWLQQEKPKAPYTLKEFNCNNEIGF